MHRRKLLLHTALSTVFVAIVFDLFKVLRFCFQCSRESRSDDDRWHACLKRDVQVELLFQYLQLLILLRESKFGVTRIQLVVNYISGECIPPAQHCVSDWTEKLSWIVRQLYIQAQQTRLKKSTQGLVTVVCASREK